MNGELKKTTTSVLIAIALIIGAAGAISAFAQTTMSGTARLPPPYYPNAGGPLQELTGVIRIPKEFGVVPAGPGVNQPTALPCAPFFVAIMDPGKTNKLVTYTDQLLEPGRGDDTYYTCKFSIMVPRDKNFYAVAGMGGPSQLQHDKRWSMYASDPWIGGSNIKPRRGYERSFAGKFFTLGNKPMYLRFDLTYVQANPD
ncbi:MAG: hypothetical protein IPI64_06150 [Chloracidobacterium sp.]|nr:hypothetical protein [Chloracidobacterium sp.]